MFSVSRRFSTATAACEASEAVISSFSSTKGTVSTFITAVTPVSGIERRLRFKSCRTPMMRPSGVFIGTTSIDWDR